MSREAISSDKAPKAIGPYSQAIRHGNLIYLSGQIGIDPATNVLVSGGVQAETQQIMKNLQAVLAAVNLDFSSVVKTTIYLKSMADFAAVNEVYSRYFKEPYPARATIEVSGLPKGALVEIEAIALSF